VAEENEACAAICDRVGDRYKAFDDRGRVAFEIAQLVRARRGGP
jgi:hypothetical protein